MSQVLPVEQLGSEILRTVASPVTDVQDPAVQQLIDDMLLTVAQANGVGIAAPQVGHSKRVIIVASRPNSRYPHAPHMPPTAMINPEILEQSPKTSSDWEGCLSVPGIRGKVPRAVELTLRYQTREGHEVSQSFSDFVARIIQHECDHLDGISFLERVDNLKTLATEQEYLRQLAALAE